jgi:hypothetical protein
MQQGPPGQPPQGGPPLFQGTEQLYLCVCACIYKKQLHIRRTSPISRHSNYICVFARVFMGSNYVSGGPLPFPGKEQLYIYIDIYIYMYIYIYIYTYIYIYIYICIYIYVCMYISIYERLCVCVCVCVCVCTYTHFYIHMYTYVYITCTHLFKCMCTYVFML